MEYIYIGILSGIVGIVIILMIQFFIIITRLQKLDEKIIEHDLELAMLHKKYGRLSNEIISGYLKQNDEH